jgi:hypothetical protein
MMHNIKSYHIECINLLGGWDKVIVTYRDTGQFMGIFMTDGNNYWLPSDRTRREIIKILNREIINSGFLNCSVEDTILI